MTRLNLAAAAGRAGSSACTWCTSQYESRRLFAELDQAQSEERAARARAASACRPSKRAQATPLRVEKPAARAARRCAPPRRPSRSTCAPDGTVIPAVARRRPPRRRRRRADVARRRTPVPAAPQRQLHDQPAARVARRRPGAASSSSRCVGARLLRAGSAARSTCRSSATTSSSSQGEVRFARTLELPASRGRILDRNGLMLATSVPAPRIWAIPKDVERDTAKLRASSPSCSDMPPAELDKQLDDETRTSSGCKRQVDEPRRASRSPRSTSRASTSAREYKRKYPEGEAAAHVVGFTNVEDNGQEGIELAFQKDLAGTRRLAPRHQGPARPRRRGHRRAACRRSTAATSQLSIDTQGAVLRLPELRDAVAEHKAKAGSVVVLDAHDRRGAGAGQLPELRARQAPEPDRRAAAQPRADRHLRARLDDEAVHRRAGARDRPRHAADADPDRARPHDASAARRSATRTRTAR